MIKNLFHWEIQGTSVLTGNLAQVFLLEDQLMETYEQMFCELHLPDLYRVWIKVHSDNWKSVKIVDLSRFWNFRWLHSSYSWNSHVLPLPLGAWQVEIENIGWFDPELRKFRSCGRRFRRWQFSQKKSVHPFWKADIFMGAAPVCSQQLGCTNTRDSLGHGFHNIQRELFKKCILYCTCSSFWVVTFKRK